MGRQTRVELERNTLAIAAPAVATNGKIYIVADWVKYLTSERSGVYVFGMRDAKHWVVVAGN